MEYFIGDVTKNSILLDKLTEKDALRSAKGFSQRYPKIRVGIYYKLVVSPGYFEVGFALAGNVYKEVSNTL